MEVNDKVFHVGEGSLLALRADDCKCDFGLAARSVGISPGPGHVARALATFAGRKLLAMLVGRPDAFGAGASRRRAEAKRLSSRPPASQHNITVDLATKSTKHTKKVSSLSL